MAEIPFAVPGDRLIKVKEEESLEKICLQLADTDPPEYRIIDINREPVVSINGGKPNRLEPLTHGEKEDLYVRDKNWTIMTWKELPMGATVDLVSYGKT